MATGQLASESRNLNLQNTDIKTAPGVVLDDHQKIIVGSILDLYDGKPSSKKLQLWNDDAIYEEPICKAHGRHEYEANWYCLAATVAKSQRQSQVISAANPVQLDQSITYTLKGVPITMTIRSTVSIFIDQESGKIQNVQDRWNPTLPDTTLSHAHLKQLANPFWWLYYAEGWAWWVWSLFWWTPLWKPVRRLTAVTLPRFFGSPKDEAGKAEKEN